MIEVRWSTGCEIGFKDMDSAQRFVDRIGMVAAPDLDFEISTLLIIPPQ